MSTAIVPSAEEVLEITVDHTQFNLTKGVKRRLQKKRALVLLKSAAESAKEQEARSLQDHCKTGIKLCQLES